MDTKTLALALSLLVTPAFAGQEIDVCNGCTITYKTTKVVKKVVRPAPVVQVIPPQYVPNGVGIVTNQVYMMPVTPQVVVQQVPVAPVCTSYPDPWDTLGYIFGDPIMITVCQ
jgi:type III secretory pathway component EscR